VYFGVLLILEKFLWQDFLKKHKIFSHIYTIFLVWIGWAIFAFDNMGKGAQYIKAMFGLTGAGFVDKESMYLLLSYAVMLIVLILAATPYPKILAGRLVDKIEGMRMQKLGVTVSAVLQCVFVAAVFIISTAYLVDATYNPFLYFRF
jgi:alginate O-acetyltransferase complex protein AlgI